MHRALLAVFVLRFAGACAPAATDRPVDAYLAFAHATQQGDAAGAFALLSATTRGMIEQRARDLATASGGALKADPAALVFSSTPHPSAVTDVKLESSDEAQALVQVTADGKAGTVRMVKEVGIWKVDLSALLQK